MKRICRDVNIVSPQFLQVLWNILNLPIPTVRSDHVDGSGGMNEIGKSDARRSLWVKVWAMSEHHQLHILIEGKMDVRSEIVQRDLPQLL